MLTKGNRVLIREDGTRKPIEELLISDLVFDPWGDKYIEIVDILSRTIDLNGAGEGGTHPLHPVMIKAGAMVGSRPREDLMVSPSQGIYYMVRSSDWRAPLVLRKGPASSIGVPFENKKVSLNTITYFAIFTEREQILDVSGVLLTTLSHSVYDDISTSSGDSSPKRGITSREPILPQDANLDFWYSL